MGTTIYYKTNLVPIEIENSKSFANSLRELPYIMYEVEQLTDGRKIVISKLGGKRNFGRISKHDFMVFIWTKGDDEDKLELLKHVEIHEDIKEKLETDRVYGEGVIDAMERVCNGEKIDNVLEDMKDFEDLKVGYDVELLLKLYKWIWGQEDVNYPKGKGRWMSMEPILELKNI